jgi:uncharacterized protein
VDGPTTRLRIRVSPGAARSTVVGRHGRGWKVRVAAAPERGKANDALLDLLATTLDIPRADVAVVSGTSSRDKTVSLRGVDESNAQARLGAAAGGTA